MQFKSEYKMFGLFLLFAGLIFCLFIILQTMRVMQKEIMLSIGNQEFLMQKLVATPTPLATPSATLTPTNGATRSFQVVPKK